LALIYTRTGSLPLFSFALFGAYITLPILSMSISGVKLTFFFLKCQEFIVDQAAPPPPAHPFLLAPAGM